MYVVKVNTRSGCIYFWDSKDRNFVSYAATAKKYKSVVSAKAVLTRIRSTAKLSKSEYLDVAYFEQDQLCFTNSL